MANTIRSNERSGLPPDRAVADLLHRAPVGGPADFPVASKGFDRPLDIVTVSEPSTNAAPTIALRFSEVASANARASAVVSAGDQLSYGELEERANQLAHLLRSRGIGRGAVVGLFVTRSVSLAVGALA